VSDPERNNRGASSQADRARLSKSLSTDAVQRLRAIGGGQRPRVMGEGPSVDEAPRAGRADYLAVKAILQERLLDEIGARHLLEREGQDVASAVQEFAARAIESENVRSTTPSARVWPRSSPTRRLAWDRWRRCSRIPP